MRTRFQMSSMLLLWSGVLTAPLASAQAPAPQFPSPPVMINGTRIDSPLFNLQYGDSPLLNGERASSCAFMAPYDPRFDPVMLAYERDFNVQHGAFGRNVAISAYAPYGDASNIIALHRAGLGGLRGGMPFRGCGQSDINAVAARTQMWGRDPNLARAFDAYQRHDYANAINLFSTAWRKVGYGGIPALMVARIYLNGEGTPQDTRKAVKWLEDVAYMPFGPGWGMRFNPAQPEAMTPRIEAAMTLAGIYEHGIGIAADPRQADKWYAKAAEFGYVPALDIRGGKGLAADADPRTRERAVGELKQAADAGYAPAQYHLARAYYEGNGVPRDLKLAGAWFDAAAHAGLPAAMFAAGHMVDAGEGVPADAHKAIVYYKDAALRGDRDAQFALGTYFYNGEVVGKDVATARKWFAASARQGQADAMYDLGAMTAKGEGGAQDRAVAYVWLTLAEQAGQVRAAAALRELAPALSSDERRRAESVLHPQVALQ